MSRPTHCDHLRDQVGGFQILDHWADFSRHPVRTRQPHRPRRCFVYDSRLLPHPRYPFRVQSQSCDRFRRFQFGLKHGQVRRDTRQGRRIRRYEPCPFLPSCVHCPRGWRDGICSRSCQSWSRRRLPRESDREYSHQSRGRSRRRLWSRESGVLSRVCKSIEIANSLDSGAHPGSCGRWICLVAVRHDGCLFSWGRVWGLARCILFQWRVALTLHSMSAVTLRWLQVGEMSLRLLQYIEPGRGISL